MEKIQKGHWFLKENGLIKRKMDWKTESVSAVIIVAAFVLSMLLSAVGYLENQRILCSAAKTAAQAMAQQVSTASVVRPPQLSDPLLVLVNSRTPLPEDWQVTPRMIDDELVDLRMYDDLTAMFDAAAEENVWFWVASGYRSVQQQEIILDRAVRENLDLGMAEQDARTEALRTIQQPGFSEHHTGLAIDLNDVSDDFESTEAYRWLSKHGAEYGFVQRYKEEKAEITGIDNESWHYRYVGKRHAKEMERLDMCLEEYIEYLRKRGVR